MINTFNRFVVANPWAVIVAFALATVVFALRIPSLHFDFDVDAVFPQDHPEIAYKNWVLDYFGVEDSVVIVIVNEGPNGVFTPETLSLVAHLSEEMSLVEGINGDDIVSLSEIDNITSEDDSLAVDPFFEDPPETQTEADRIRAAVFENPMMVGTVVSREGRATLVAGEALPGVEKTDVHSALERIVQAAPHGGSTLEIAGRPIVESQMVRINTNQIARVLPLVAVTAAAALALSLHSIRGVLLPLLVVLSSVVWTLGMMSWTNQTFSALNSSLPMMLIPIGIADGIHVIHYYMHTLAEKPHLAKKEAVLETMRDMTTAVMLTSFTTAAGLCSLATSSLSTNRNYGYFAAFGTIAAMIFSLTVLPALLAVLPRPRRGLARSVEGVSSEPGPVRRSVDRLTDLVTQRPAKVLTGTLFAMFFLAVGTTMLTTDGSLLKNYPAGDPIRHADAVLSEHFGGSTPLEIVIDGGEMDAWKSPENLRALVAFQSDVEAIEGVGEARSIADYLRRMNDVMNPSDPNADRIPDDRELIAQYLLLYSISGEPDDFDDVVDYDYALANVRAQTASDHSPDVLRVLQAIRTASDEHLAPVGLEAHPSGSAREIYEFVDVIVSSQIASLVAALILVWAMSAVMFRSFVAGLLTTLPVGFATIATFGGLGWVGEPVGVTTAVMAAIAIGIGVDYAVHFVSRYRDCCRRGMTTTEAMRATLNTSGIAIFLNAVVVVAGFLAMATSEFLPPRAMGLLVSWNMVVCFITTITTLAALLAWLNPAFLRAGANDEA